MDKTSKKMKKAVEVINFQVSSPYHITLKRESISSIPKDYALLKPLISGICSSDIRYYTGNRPEHILKKKYPLTLFHEGVAEVIDQNCKGLEKRDRVVVIPNIPCSAQKKELCISCKKGLGENYCLDTKFRSSNAPGICKTVFLHPDQCLIKIPKNIPDHIAALTEPLTIAYRAIKEANISNEDVVSVIGCGQIGYFVCIVLAKIYKHPKERLIAIDRSSKQLEKVSEFAKTVDTSKKKISHNTIDKAIECVGCSEDVIQQAVDILRPKGTLVLIGLTDKKTQVCTRDIVSKGLSIKGTSRSEKDDFKAVIRFLGYGHIQKILEKIIYEKTFKGDIKGIKEGLEKASNTSKKVLISWA